MPNMNDIHLGDGLRQEMTRLKQSRGRVEDKKDLQAY